MADPLHIDTDPVAQSLDESHISPTDATTRDKLERSLKERPDKKELVERNILKNTTVSPALQGRQAELERARLNDQLDQALSHRPKPEELVKQGILGEDEVPPV